MRAGWEHLMSIMDNKAIKKGYSRMPGEHNKPHNSPLIKKERPQAANRTNHGNLHNSPPDKGEYPAGGRGLKPGPSNKAEKYEMTLGWKQRRVVELALMEDLTPYLQKLAMGMRYRG